MRRRWLVAILAAALLLPSTTLAQSGSVRDLLAGDVLRGQTGETDDLELTAEEFTAAIRRVEELRAGLIVADPATLPTSADPERLAAIEAATTARLQEAGMIVDRCVVTPEVTAAACMEQLFQGDALILGRQPAGIAQHKWRVGAARKVGRTQQRGLDLGRVVVVVGGDVQRAALHQARRQQA